MGLTPLRLPNDNFYSCIQAVEAHTPKTLLTLPRACLMPNFAKVEQLLVGTLKNLLESDAATLDAWFESEIRAFFAQRSRRGREVGFTLISP